MYKAKNSDVKMLIKWGAEDGAIAHMVRSGLQPIGNVYAYYAPSQANWSWQIGIYAVNGEVYELLTRFGSVEGGRKLHLHQNNYGGAA